MKHSQMGCYRQTHTQATSNFKRHHGHGLTESGWKAANKQGAAGIDCTVAWQILI